MNLVETKWQQLRDTLQLEIAGRSNVVCRIPGWEPVDLEMGLRWFQSSIYEGYDVAYHVKADDDVVTIWFKLWECGESEPAWPAVV